MVILLNKHVLIIHNNYFSEYNPRIVTKPQYIGNICYCSLKVLK